MFVLVLVLVLGMPPLKRWGDGVDAGGVMEISPPQAGQFPPSLRDRMCLASVP
jgi:hypothetical protein